MNEQPPSEEKFISKEEELARKEVQKELLISLALELSESSEIFPFPGIDSEHYNLLKAEDEEFPGYSTPIDELLQRFVNEGMKVSLGLNPQAGNLYFLPSGSDDIVSDSLLPRHLNLSGDLSDELREVIFLSEN